ncbi:hypothetical protein F5883DRAFT_638510 [Diaporthe sp. PMI_573]|nr:hypothetical protein F5883DRAFT_638510 [Diaporthaceae sp. PMI_573]
MHYSKVYFMLSMATSAVYGLVPQVPRNLIITDASHEVLRREKVDVAVGDGFKRDEVGVASVADGFKRDEVKVAVGDGFKRDEVGVAVVDGFKA